MKNLTFKLGIIVALGALILSSCGKNDNPDNPGGDENTTLFSAKVSGVDFTAVLNDAFITSGGFLAVGGVNDQGAAISIVINQFTGEATYSLNALSQNAGSFFPDTSNTDNFYSTFTENGTGNIIVTKWNDTDSIVSGTFDFTAQHVINGDEKNITQGVFNNLNVRLDNSEEGLNNRFAVKIDGNLWDEAGGTVGGGLSQGLLNLTAVNISDNSSFFVILPGDITPGEYQLTGIPTRTIIYSANNITYVPTSGLINITEHNTTDKHIEATFEFVGDGSGNTKNFTEGELSISYQ